jgi:hypothetical protein
VNSAIDYHELPAAPLVGLDGQPLSGRSRGSKSAPDCLLKAHSASSCNGSVTSCASSGYEHMQIDVCEEALAGVEAS